MCAPTANAADNTLNMTGKAASLTVQEQRKLYRAARRALRSGNIPQFEMLKSELREYPLYPYLVYNALRAQSYHADLSVIRDFQAEYPNSPLGGPLYRNWLESLIKHRQWQTFVNAYQPGSNDRLDCLYYRGHYKLGDYKTAYSGAEQLWVVDHNQDKSCDPLFKVWQKSAAFTHDIAWQRFAVAMQARNVKLARYVKRFLNPSQQVLAKQWLSVYRQPRQLKNTLRFQRLLEDHPEATKAIVASGLKRLLHRQRQLAHRLLQDYERHANFSDTQRQNLYDYYARNLAVNYHPEAQHWLNLALANDATGKIPGYAIRHALRERDWQRVIRWIALLPQAEQQRPAWRYWRARAHSAIALAASPILHDIEEHPTPFVFGASHNLLSLHDRFVYNLSQYENFNELLPGNSRAALASTETPVALLRSLTGLRNYYGFLASDTLNQAISLNHQPYQPSAEELDAVFNTPGVLRAQELFALGSPQQAMREWHYAVRHMPASMRNVAARIAAGWGWNYKAIIAAAGADNRDDLDIRFPRPHYDAVALFTQRYDVQPDWVYSLMRQESAFLPNARSPVGAMGLMQLMPKTAREVARKSRIRLRNKKQLLNAKTNIRLGTAYMSQLLKRFDGNLVVASAAYNAGPHRAERWQPKHNSMAGDIWVETIPIKETRNYVKNIVTYQPIYQRHLGMQPTLTTDIAVIEPDPKSAQRG